MQRYNFQWGFKKKLMAAPTELTLYHQSLLIQTKAAQIIVKTLIKVSKAKDLAVEFLLKFEYYSDAQIVNCMYCQICELCAYFIVSLPLTPYYLLMISTT